MEHFLKDVRHGVRNLANNRAMSALAVLAIAVGIGTVTCQFSVVYGILFRGLPLPEAERLCDVEWAGQREQDRNPDIAIQDLVEFQRQQTSFEGLAGMYNGTVNFRADGAPVRLDGAFISAGWSQMLRIQPILGRGFDPGEDQPGAEPVAIVSYGLWQRDLAGSPDAIGRTVHVNGQPCKVIGIMPDGFGFPSTEQIWVPLPHRDVALPRGQGTTPTLDVFGRLKPGVSMDEATTELTAIARRLQQEFPEANKHFNAVQVRPIIDEFTGNNLRGILWTMLFASFLVLGVACANVANLLLAQASKRTKELGVRAALGASRGRLVVQMLTEALVLAALGAALGVGLAHLGNSAIWSAVVKLEPPYWMHFSIEGPILAFVVAVALVTTLLSGLVPALQASRTDVNSILKDDARTSSSLHLGRFARVLVVAQVALSFGLIAVALLMAKSGRELSTLSFPYEPKEVFSARIAMFDSDYPSDADRVKLFDQLETSLQNEPEVEAVAFSGNYRFFGAGGRGVALDGVVYQDERERPTMRREVIGGGYFSLLRTAVLEGRDLVATDFQADAPRVAIINTVMAKRLFPGRSPVGLRFDEGRPDEPRWVTVVGVAPDLRMQGVESDPDDDGAGYYVPYGQDVPRFMTVLLRARGGGAERMAEIVRRVLAPLDPNLPIYEAYTLDHHIVEQLRGYKLFADIFAGLGVSALFLASIGVYGVMAFAVSQRRQEIGIRMALGASPAGILRMVMLQGGRQILVGLVCGLLVAAGLGKLIAGFLENVPPYDALVYGVVTLVFGFVGLAAIFGPAARAATVSPVQALRQG